MSQSWDHVRNQVRQFRTNFQSMYPIQVLTIIKDFTVYCNHLYFLSNHVTSADTCPSRKVLLYKVNLSHLNPVQIPSTEDDQYLTATRQLPLSNTSIPFTDYLSLDEKGNTVQNPLPGISSMERIDNTLMMTYNGNIYISDKDKMPTLIPYKDDSPISDMPPKKTNYNKNEAEIASRRDPKLGKDTITFIRDRDLWSTDFLGNERQLTFCKKDQQDDTLSCGIAEYMMQEEFHRWTGYHRSPLKNHILYLETSEKEVEQVMISKNAMHEPIRYPRAGKANAKSVLKLVEFDDPHSVVHKQLWGEHQIQTQFPWMEYIVRFGWLPDGQSMWLQILSRDQKKTAVLKLYPSQFTITDTNTSSMTQILWEETNPHWINITDTFQFIKTSSSLEKVEFIWSSEKENGYRHLYHIEAWDRGPIKIRQLTRGRWPCIDRPLYIDEERALVYFTAKKESPLESHFYVLSYQRPTEPVLLTQRGYSHTISMNSPDYFIDCFSTLSDPRIILIQQIQHDDYNLLSTLLLPAPDLLTDDEIEFKYDGSTPLRRRESSDVTNLQDIVPNGHIFSFQASDGVLLYGCLYKPRHYQPNTSYPTVLHIYGGPKTQLVTNEFKFPRLMRYLMSVYFGFAVVIIDSRGSTDRGLEFEAQLQSKLGRVELKDQIEGLLFLHDSKFGAVGQESVIDLKRVAISGWSYGGYLSLMGLALYGDFFKMAIAGAPVTEWELYDAAYTERYMGLPDEQAEAYRKSSVLTYASQFPDTENRLLIAHGLMDENVHYKHTEVLVTELVKENKPHYLQVYPSEKHGLRHASVNEHFETLMFYWLINYL